MNNEPENIDLAYYLSVLFKRVWVIITVTMFCILCAILYNTFSRPVYESCAMIMIDREEAGKIDSVRNSAWNADEDYYRTQYKLLESRTLLEKVYHTLNLYESEEFGSPNGIVKLKKAIKIEPVTRSRLVNITASSFDPVMSAAIANTLSQKFVSENLTNRITMAKDVIQALESTQKSKQQQELLNSMPQVVNSDFIKNLKQQEASLQSEYAKLSSKYTQNHPELISLQKQLNAVREKITVETNRLVQSIKIELSGQFSGNNIRIIDRAVTPLFPAKPKKLINIMLGIIGGLFISGVLVFIIEFLDQTIKSAEDLELKTGLPFLGFVPEEKQKKNESEYALMLKKGHFLLAENVRNIRTMLDFSLLDKDKAVLITSSLQGEGKSNLSANLSIAIAQTDKKVLLVDGDLRRSRLHKVFKVSNEKGLSNILSEVNPQRDFASNIQKTEVKGLSILTSGQRPPNPAELLNTPLLSAFIAWAKDNYDMVIVDCPALMPVSDTLLWGKYINKAVFVIKFSSTNVKIITAAVEKLAKSSVKILGTVITRYRAQGIGYSKYRYYQDYSYYDEDEEKKTK